jgi:hypothetical protein
MEIVSVYLPDLQHWSNYRKSFNSFMYSREVNDKCVQVSIVSDNECHADGLRKYKQVIITVNSFIIDKFNHYDNTPVDLNDKIRKTLSSYFTNVIFAANQEILIYQ